MTTEAQSPLIDRISQWLSLAGSDELFGAVIIVALIMFMFAFWRAQSTHKLDWTDMIVAPGSDNSVSLTKVLQLIGGMVGTWIVIKLTIQGKIGYDIFGLYLLYVGSVEAYSKYVIARYYNPSSNTSLPPPGYPNGSQPTLPTQPIGMPQTTITTTVNQQPAVSPLLPVPLDEGDDAEYDKNGKLIK